MKRLVLLVAVVFLLGLPSSALAFHHTGLPSTVCAADAAGSPSNDNGLAKEKPISVEDRLAGRFDCQTLTVFLQKHPK